MKNGEQKIYASLEEAAADTGLSVRTIKSRCVNEGKTGRDGITFKWQNTTTKQAFKAKQSRSKGNQCERDVVHDLREIGYDVYTSRSESKRLDDAKVDIAGEIPYYIQIKHTATQPNYYKIEESCPLKDKPFCIVWKKAFNDGSRSPETIVMIPYSQFLTLIKK